jgi:transcriptional regulator with GAF, ATPase, and Fis domain
MSLPTRLESIVDREIDAADLPAPWTPTLRLPRAAGLTVPSAAASIAAGALRCEQLIADLATRLATADVGAIEDTIADGLRRIAAALHLDRAAVSPGLSSRVAAAPPEFEALLSIPFILRRLARGEAVWFSRVEELPPGARQFLTDCGWRSAAVLPLASAGRDGRTLIVGSTMVDYEWSPEAIERIRLAASVFALALARNADDASRPSAFEERPMARQYPSAFKTPRLIVSESPAIRETIEQVAQVAPTPATVLLLGETGAGKEVLAQAIHDNSPRRLRPMIRVSCAAIPAALIESELFGRERGAYTGAITRQIGRFEAADQSTLFLDEIGELPPDIQVKLLRVLQDKTIERLGSSQSVKVDVRIIAATNRNLEKAVEDKSFREDLFYRLNVFPIVVPPLRERPEDIRGLVWTFVDEFSKAFGKPIDAIADESMARLQEYAWPGNVRELRNVIERAVILANGRRLSVPMPQSANRAVQRPLTLTNLESDHILATLESTSWRIRGAGGAAEILGLKPTTLESRMAKLGLVRPER